MRDYPQMSDHTKQVEPVPRRIRGFLGGVPVFDTMAARYVWDSPKYPQYLVPLADLDPAVLVFDDDRPARGQVRRAGLRSGDQTRPDTVRVYQPDAEPDLADMVRIIWGALDAWFEEDEQVYVHPRNPYTRVDALRSGRTVQVQLGGVTLVESSATVMVFETGLPTRYYFDRTSVNFDVLEPSSTQTECPYKGTTSAYWSAKVGGLAVPDVAWSYAFPTRQLLPITNLVAFYNEHTDITVDGRLQDRPTPVH